VSPSFKKSPKIGGYSGLIESISAVLVWQNSIIAMRSRVMLVILQIPSCADISEDLSGIFYR
jgi:hypothetical protein